MLASFSPGSRLRAISVPFLVHKYEQTKDTRELGYCVQVMNRISFFVMVPAFIVLMLLADEVMLYIFKPEYLEIAPLFVLSLGFLLIQQFSYTYTAILLTLEKTKIIFVASFAAIYNLIMDLVLIPPLGILGAIIATGSAGAFLPFYYHFAVKREGTISLKYPWRSFARFSINTVLTAIMVFFLRGIVCSLLSLIAVLAISGLVYLALSYLNKGFEEQDRNIINEAIGRKIFVF
jgi:O-antigen/teichoic acid export membrane protein